jgi:hypothetical protein
MTRRPLALDLCSGLGGWADGLEAEGWDVIRVDIADMFAETATPKPVNCQLMLQDIRTFHGSQAKRCSLIVASPPCTEFSWMAMPWSRAKQVAQALKGETDFPANYKGSRTVGQLTELFEACFRIQREACEAAGRHIPLIVENVRGAQPWVGRARWNYGSYYLWGDVPALMPVTFKGSKVPGFRFDGSGKSFQSASVEESGFKTQGMNWSDRSKRGQDFTRIAGKQALSYEGIKQRGSGREWFAGDGKISRKSPARKMASAMIAKIPEPLSRYIAATFRPVEYAEAAE